MRLSIKLIMKLRIKLKTKMEWEDKRMRTKNRGSERVTLRIRE